MRDKDLDNEHEEASSLVLRSFPWSKKIWKLKINLGRIELKQKVTV